MIYFLKQMKIEERSLVNLNTNENIINKLKYLGLDLDNIPEIISNFETLDYRPLKYNDEHIYKVYKYVNINDI